MQDAGKVCVLDIEVEGVKQIRDSDLNPVLVFVMPPSIEELKRRLVDRKTETPESLKKRLDTAHREIEYGSDTLFYSLIWLSININEREFDVFFQFQAKLQAISM